MTIKRRNQTIDLLRFLFSIIIVIHHSRYLLGDDECMFLGGSLAVEFFFLVSGYLMMASIEKKNRQKQIKSLPKEAFEYFKHKLCTWYPEVLVAWMIAAAFTYISCSYDIKEMAEHFLNSSPEAFLLRSFGLSASNVNGATWYLSSMLISMLILYPLLRRYPTAMKYLVMPLSALAVLGWLCTVDNHPRDPTKWIGITLKGNYRALAELELGALCFFSAQKIRKVPFNRLARVLLSIVEIGCYVGNIVYMFFETPSRTDIFFIALFCLGICLSFSEQTLLRNLPECPAILWLGKFSFPLYLSHQCYALFLNNLLPESFTNNQRMAVYLVCAFSTALVVWGISTLLRKHSSRILALCRRLFLQEPALSA